MNKIRSTIAGFVKLHHVRQAIYVWLIMVFLQVALLIIKWRDLPPQVPLFYSRPWGREQLASVVYLSIFPISSIIVGIINGFFAIVTYRHEELLASMLVLSAVVMTLLAIVGLYKIVFLVL